ncbi:MAG: hypothetical protein HW380_2403 [Magnetococcales bacterium]|nr:hypothetical protein [Magnetococcales bacterium]
MGTTPLEAAKTMANLLANHLAFANNVPHLLESMRRLGMFNGQMDLPTQKNIAFPHFAPGDASTLLGLWKPVEKEGQFCHERIDTDYFNISRWSSMERIGPKSSKKRIVYLGESVARGFFFDPHFNPVAVMEAMLAEEPADTGYEIIDLACNGQFMQPMLKLAYDALALRPDMFILFAGNNWLEPASLWRETGFGMAEALRQGEGVGGINRIIETWLEERTRAFIRQLTSLAETHHLPITVVIPEFNLLDFATDNIAGTPYLLAGTINHSLWYKTRNKVPSLMQAAKYSEVEPLTKQLIELDGGTTSTAFSLLARCQLAQGKKHEARHSLERSRDAMLWCWPLLTPRCPAVVRDTIRKEIGQGSPWLSMVDLPDRFTTWLDGELPGRDIFFDYCHLTAKGTTMVAAAMVETILERLDGGSTDFDTLMARAPTPTPEMIGRAHLFAAMHNASWGQPRELVRHHAHQAAQTPHQVELATRMADIASRCLPGALCEPFPEILQTNDLFAIFRLADMGERRHDLLVDELTAAFQKSSPELADHVHQIRLRELGIARTGVDLLNPRQHISSWCQPETDWWEKTLYFSAYTQESRFLLVCPSRSDNLRLALTCRIPEDARSMLQIRINDTLLQEITVSASWSTHRLLLPAHLLVAGKNEITLVWPVVISLKNPTDALVNLMLSGGISPPTLFQPLGEVSTFRAEPIHAESLYG